MPAPPALQLERFVAVFCKPSQAMSIPTELEHFMEYVFGFCAALDEVRGSISGSFHLQSAAPVILAVQGLPRFPLVFTVTCWVNLK